MPLKRHHNTHNSDQIRDDVWCFLVARRAVARASLHLGVTTMSQEALDVMAELVLAYLEKCAHKLAISMESSRRCTANALDALSTIPLCTSPAVQRIHRSNSTNNHTTSAGGGTTTSLLDESISGGDVTLGHGGPDPTHDLSWKGLAAFMFGSNWEQLATTMEGVDKGMTASVATMAARRSATTGGKVGPSSLDNENQSGIGSLPSSVAAVGGGWCAPYPDEMPPFPVSIRSRKAEPQSSDMDGNSIDDTPDGVFGKSQWWGMPADMDHPDTGTAVVSGMKRKRDDEHVDGDSGDIISSKRVQFADTTPISTQSVSASLLYEDLLLPRFLPPFPKQVDVKRAVIEEVPKSSTGKSMLAPSTAKSKSKSSLSRDDEEVVEMADDPGLVVRSSLVSLQQSSESRDFYWGSGWDDTNDNNSSTFAVPWGRPPNEGTVGSSTTKTSTSPAAPSGAAAAGASSTSAAASLAPTTSNASAPSSSSVVAPIVPLGRASGSRVSRILEGSMDGP